MDKIKDFLIALTIASLCGMAGYLVSFENRVDEMERDIVVMKTRQEITYHTVQQVQADIKLNNSAVLDEVKLTNAKLNDVLVRNAKRDARLDSIITVQTSK